MLGHGLEQGGLGLRHRAVDLVDEQDVGEDRPGAELELAHPLIEHGQPGDVGRLEVGGALDAPDGGAVDRAGERPCEDRLRRAGHVLEEDVPARGERRQDEIDPIGLAAHDRLDVVAQAFGGRGRPLEALVRLDRRLEVLLCHDLPGLPRRCSVAHNSRSFVPASIAQRPIPYATSSAVAGRPSDRGAPAPTRSMSPAIAGHELMPAASRACHSTFPVVVEKPRIVPSNAGAKTTSSGDGRAAEVRRADAMAPADRARRGVEGVENPRPLARRPLEDACRGDRALPHAEIEHRDEHRVGRERHGAQHSAEQAGAHEGLLARKRADVVQVPPHRLLPDPFVGLAVPGDHPAGLAGAEDHRPTIRPDGREDRGDVEVVVADVVVEHLVVPDDLAGGAVQDDQRVGVERAAGEPGAVRVPRRAAPRAGVRDADVDTALRVDRHRVPRPTPAGVFVRPGLRDRLEPPDPASRRASSA